MLLQLEYSPHKLCMLIPAGKRGCASKQHLGEFNSVKFKTKLAHAETPSCNKEKHSARGQHVKDIRVS